jgi:hypothetical protein
MPFEEGQHANVDERDWGAVVNFSSFCLSIRRKEATQGAKQSAIVNVIWHAGSVPEFRIGPFLAFRRFSLLSTLDL